MNTFVILSTFLIGAPANWRITWAHTGLDVRGQPETLTSFEVVVTDSTGKKIYQNAVGPTVRSVTLSTPALPDGTYTVSVVAIDAAGNRSTAATTTVTQGDTTPPEAPTTLEVQKGTE